MTTCGYMLIDGRASRLPSVVFRVALLAVLRSKRLEGATIGVMITASHNPEPVSSTGSIDLQSVNPCVILNKAMKLTFVLGQRCQAGRPIRRDAGSILGATRDGVGQLPFNLIPHFHIHHSRDPPPCRPLDTSFHRLCKGHATFRA